MRAPQNRMEQPGSIYPDLGHSPTLITSRENRWLKMYREALRGSRVGGDGLIGLEGPHLIEEAIRSGLKLNSVLVSPAGEKCLPLLSAYLKSGDGEAAGQPPVLHTTDKLFASVAGTETPQGIAALAMPRTCSFEDLLRGDVPLVVVMAAVQDPGNVGTILRSSEAFGATGAIATRGSAHPFAPKALRASTGSALRMPLLDGIAAPVALAQLRVSGLRIFAASSRHDVDCPGVFLSQADLRAPSAILIGNEGAGLTPELIRSADETILIPLARDVESLNAAVAASILLYEAARQRSTASMA